MSRTPTWTRPLGFLAGCLIAVGFVVSGQVPESAAQAGPSVEVRSGSFAELSVAPAGQLISARNILPGRAARARLSVQNPTDVTLSVRPRLAFRRELPRGLHARVVSNGREIFSGPVEGLSHGSPRGFTIRPRARRPLTLEISVPRQATAATRYSARSARLDLLTRVTRD